MIRNTKQQWLPGNTVKVGFLTLRVLRAVPTPGDFEPDAYLMCNLANTKLYRFVPHKGLHAIDMDEANAMIAEAVRLAGPVQQRARVAA